MNIYGSALGRPGSRGFSKKVDGWCKEMLLQTLEDISKVLQIVLV